MLWHSEMNSTFGSILWSIQFTINTDVKQLQEVVRNGHAQIFSLGAGGRWPWSYI